MSGRRRFTPLPAQVDLPALEHEVLQRWRDTRVFERSLAASAGRPQWTFYEGPPTANGTPGTHHVEARVFKDLFPRFKTMKGFHVPRKAGWDCHGLPVELQVERELGFSGKQDIETYGIAEFNAKCRESVERHVDAFERLTERMGYWVDMSQAYWTMDPTYIDSVWWSLKKIFDAGLLVRDHRVAPYCPRCGTPLSDHEVAQGYLTVTDPSVYVRFPLTSGPYAGKADLLVWTTTPWTLVSNTAVAVHPDVEYVVADTGDGTPVIVAAPLVEAALQTSPRIIDRLRGREMERWSYCRPFDLVSFDAAAHYVVLAEYVTTDDGTGLVHQAPAFGADDLAVSRVYGLPVVNPVRADGTFQPTVPLVGGMFFKDADRVLVDDLRARGLLLRLAPYEHSYPHCWRCDTPLLYYALPTWYIRTTAVKDKLLEENEKTNWFPETIKHGRYGDWLRNNVDWALSRNRYWGTPLPLWTCPAGHVTCVGSRAELGNLAGQELSGLDPHRPYVDAVTFPCPVCGAEARRVPEVIDGWYDSGAMPFAQFGYPFAGVDEFERSYPADFICEAIDQTRGWFYTLMAVGTLVFGRSSYRNVVCLGHILAEDGRKMSKHLGNILEPMPLMERHGADALRWFMLASGSPWVPRRVGHDALDEVVRKVLLTYWNTASFFVLYANASGWTPSDPAPPVETRPLLDRWALSRVHATTAEVDNALESFDSAGAGRRLSELIDDLSNWYVRRSRRRFWEGDAAALATLYECLEVLTRLLAPFVPFITDYVHSCLVTEMVPSAPDSVHLREWPAADPARIDPALDAQMALLRKVVELGRAARAESKLRVRQPLRRALVRARGWSDLPAELVEQVADELNVRQVVDASTSDVHVITRMVKPNFRALGKRFGQRTPRIAAAITAAEPNALSRELSERGTVQVTVDGEPVDLGPDDVIVSEAPAEGWVVASDGEIFVALDIELTPELVSAGIAREVIRFLQDARKNSGLDISDRIEVWWQAERDDVAAAIREHAKLISTEVLAVAFTEGRPNAEIRTHHDDDLRLTAWLRTAGG
ncbi:Isoleucyl-tRNA synthetase [Acidothermus cellulolyticus 11B]|uniref:Isoleucine--tRNA ligase n=1 Tax=Acidothermus cellulolyticus (strain ATCC 43068 / DSM 8971 / 11B) TaxID=351607 RepID=A0LTP2_ACIC1|nr:isoleucine--tRNA ligase [Acidothermus cellulolyticus]ABK52802.1 Isoleucyl-tRNA synthetase [Acidothermus cellulolyticus 11B]